MTCAQTREILSAYVDGELPPDLAMETAEHLSACAECGRDYEAMLATVRTAREGLARHHAPDVLRARIRASLREEQPSAVKRVPVARRTWHVPWRTLAAAVVIVVASSGLTLLAGNRRAAEPVAQEVLASHIRSLMPEHLTDVRSSDQHNVKPWFNGRMDFSPAVPRLEDQGFPLLGGRIDYVHGRSVAVVVYGRRQHVINVFSWPVGADGDSRPVPRARNGYNLVSWRQDGVEYWAASDLNAPELRQFVALFR